MIRYLRKIGLFLSVMTVFAVSARTTAGRDTVFTPKGDRIAIDYRVTDDNGSLSIDLSRRPRIINPSHNLIDECGGESDRLKIVTFDRVGSFGKVQWKGVTPSAFIVPAGLSYGQSQDGFHIIGECGVLEFEGTPKVGSVLELPVYIAVYQKKHRYKILQGRMATLRIPLNKGENATSSKTKSVERRKELIPVTSTVELDGDNSDLSAALSSMHLVSEMIERETEVPFSQTLQMEIYNLRGLKNRISDPDVISQINALLLRCDDRERELKEEGRSAEMAAQAQEAALKAQEKQEEAEREKKAEEEARAREEKQQKRTIWMIIGGVILGILTFIGNALFKNFRDMRNQRNIMKMQESLTREAQGEATRRAREVVRNKAHQAANKGRNKMREMSSGKKKETTAKKKDKNDNNNTIRSI